MTLYVVDKDMSSKKKTNLGGDIPFDYDKIEFLIVATDNDFFTDRMNRYYITKDSVGEFVQYDSEFGYFVYPVPFDTPENGWGSVLNMIQSITRFYMENDMRPHGRVYDLYEKNAISKVGNVIRHGGKRIQRF